MKNKGSSYRRVALYFDNLITDEPLIYGLYDDSLRLKTKSKIYNLPSKLEITLYSLYSYSVIDFSTVIIKYELSRKNEKYRKFFEREVRRLFPSAQIIRKRSKKQADFLESLKLLRKHKCTWVWYAGNVDHPYIGYENELIYEAIRKAEKFRRSYDHVVIWITHCFEILSMCDEKTILTKKNYKKIEEDENFVVCLVENDNPVAAGMGLIHINTLHYIITSKDWGESKVVRLDGAPVKISKFLAIIPKTEFCEHFDGYSHSQNTEQNIDDIIPPLFIPPGFFEKKVKISAYYPKYRMGWVNINPLKEFYSFRSIKKGTDLKIIVERIPLFWRNRITLIDINKNANLEEIYRAYELDRKKRRVAWALRGPFDRYMVFVRNANRRLRFFFENPNKINLESGGWQWSLAKKCAYYLFLTLRKFCGKND